MASTPYEAFIDAGLQQHLQECEEQASVIAKDLLAEWSVQPINPSSQLKLLQSAAIPAVSLPPPSIDKTVFSPQTPCVVLDSKESALSSGFSQTLQRHPCVLVKNISSVLELDLRLFLTKTLMETAPNQEIELRIQKRRSAEGADGKGWKCRSHVGTSTIAEYGEKQVQDYCSWNKNKKRTSEQPTLTDGTNGGGGPSKRLKPENYNPDVPFKKSKKSAEWIEFGTNVDLSDEVVWKKQMDELDKLPELLRLKAKSNILSEHLGQTVLGMNSLQLYMKIPGCRTPGHKENCDCASVNINIGPGDTEWFCVSPEYWPVIHQLCQKRRLKFLSDPWWPSLKELEEARVPVYRFRQKAGDLVWINAGTVHWVQAVGWCNNIAWNVMPMTSQQFNMAVARYEFDKVQRFKSIIPVVHLAWSMAAKHRFLKTEEPLWKMVRGVLRQSLKYSHDLLEVLKHQNVIATYWSKAKDEAAHYCADCQAEVFNVLFTLSTDASSTYIVHCYDCAEEKSGKLKENIQVFHQFTLKALMRKYDKCQLFDQ